MQVNEKTLSLKGIHPDFGEVTLSQLLATWTAHDLDHINSDIACHGKTIP
jgi:hypothetical protein